MASEIAAQPSMFETIYGGRGPIEEVARRVREFRPRFVLLAARGSSDHAALYAKYLVEVLLGLPAGLVSPSSTTLYGARPDLDGVLLLAVSQSGGSPDLVEVTSAAERCGALTVAVTNTGDSPLREAAALSVDIEAGTELAVAATKTYTASLLALYLLVDAIRGGDGTHAKALPDLAQSTLDSSMTAVDAAVTRYRFVERVITCGRGYSSATAAEAALKLAETSYLAARSYSGADLLHGPVAAVDAETAVLAITSVGRGGQAMREVIDTVTANGADVVAVGSAAADVNAGLTIPVAETVEEVAPILEILPVQRLAFGLAIARGGDPDHPRGLHKVTKTR